MSRLRHSLFIESTKRSAYALRFGLRAGNRTGVYPGSLKFDLLPLPGQVTPLCSKPGIKVEVDGKAVRLGRSLRESCHRRMGRWRDTRGIDPMNLSQYEFYLGERIAVFASPTPIESTRLENSALKIEKCPIADQ
jgi:hypothetical protein